jgi:hypothetical protein
MIHHGKRLIIDNRLAAAVEKEREMMKLKILFGPETCYDQPVRRTTRTPVEVVARHPGCVAHTGNRRTAPADQARIDLWHFLEVSNS